LRLQDHSTLIWIPHPLIPGAGTIFRQQTQIEIAPTARLAFAEIWTAGRIGMQEVWQFQQVTSDCQIWCRAANTDPHPLIWERLDLHFPHTHVQSDGILGPYTCWGSLYLLGDWDIPVWPWSATQWSMPIPPAQPAQGWILRQVGDQADLIWQRFRDLIRQLCLES
jgi:urease accessory protein